MRVSCGAKWTISQTDGLPSKRRRQLHARVRQQWHDSADQEFINLNLPEPEYSHRFLMTTWHTDESPEEVATYFVNTVFPGETSIEEYSHFLVVQWGGDWLLAERLRAAVAAAAEESVDADSDAGGDDDEAA